MQVIQISSLRDSTQHSAESVTAIAVPVRRNRNRLLLIKSEHSRIVEAIKAEDAEGARAAMRAHIEGARTRLLTDSTEP